MTNILITGGAGFIGSRLAESLAKAGYLVGVLDTMHPQVHSNPEKTLASLGAAKVKFWLGDVRDARLVRQAMIDLEATMVVHLAAETGTGQSYDIPAHYCDVNVTGTARLVEAIRTARAEGLQVNRVLLAGSRAVYGEGACLTAEGHIGTAVPRLVSDLAAGHFTPKDSAGRPVQPLASRADTTVPAPASIYASTKLMQEYVIRQGLEPEGIDCGIFRLQNVYGAGQSLHNPYTGVLSIFAQQLLNGKTLNIFEDGQIVRDFVHVSDVVTAFHKVCEMEKSPGATLDIGSGKSATILDVAHTMVEELGLGEERITISGDFRAGDVRFAAADISATERLLGWRPQVTLRDGIRSLVDWASRSL